MMDDLLTPAKQPPPPFRKRPLFSLVDPGGGQPLLRRIGGREGRGRKGKWLKGAIKRREKMQKQASENS